MTHNQKMNQHPAFRLYQAEAAKVWAENSGRIKRFRGSDMTEDFIRLVQRIIPMTCQTTLYRAEGFATKSGLAKRVAEILQRGGFSAGRIAISFTIEPRIALRLSAIKGDFCLLFAVTEHSSARHIAPVVDAVSPGHGAEQEVVFPHGTRFRLLGIPSVTTLGSGLAWRLNFAEAGR